MNSFRNLTVGQKISFCFGLLFFVIVILGIFWQLGISSLKKDEQKKNDLIELKEKLREMQVVHYHWVDNLREAARKHSRFEGETDPTQCVFGKWYYSYKLPYPELEGLYKVSGRTSQKTPSVSGSGYSSDTAGK